MLPQVIKVLFDALDITSSEDFTNLLESKEVKSHLEFIDLLVDLAYSPSCANKAISDEAYKIIESIVKCNICFYLLNSFVELMASIAADSPKWKRDALDSILVQITMRKNGLCHMIITLMDRIGDKCTIQAAQKIAYNVCRPPPDNVDVKVHYCNLATQILDLLEKSSLEKIIDSHKNDENRESILRFSQMVALECVHLFGVSNSGFAEEYLLKQLFQDFSKLLMFDSRENPDILIVLTSDRFIKSLNLHNSLLNTSKPRHLVHRALMRYSFVYLDILNELKIDTNEFRAAAKAILVRLIDLIQSKERSIEYIKALAEFSSIESVPNLPDCISIRQTLDRQSVEAAVNIIINISDDDRKVERTLRRHESLIEILENLSKDSKADVIGGLYVNLLECRFHSMMQQSKESIKIRMTEESSDGRFLLDNFLALLSEKLETVCFKKSTDILRFAEVSFNNCTKMMENEGSDIESINETLNFVLKIIICVLECIELTPTDLEILKRLFEPLQQLRYGNNKVSDTNQDAATDICIFVATKGLVNPLQGSSNSIVEEVAVDVTDPQLKEAFKCLSEGDVPIKAMGLDILQLLLVQRNEEALGNRNRIFQLCSCLLFHADSYVYLRAIHCLSVMGDMYTDKLVPIIASRVKAGRVRVQLVTGAADGNISDPVANWMALSEAFMKIIRGMGQTAVRYRDCILGALLVGLRDNDDLVRASSVSNLSELCCQLDFGLTPVIYEVVTTISNTVKVDSSSRVRVACAIFFRKLILGRLDDSHILRDNLMKMFSIDVLLIMFRTIKHALNTETDSIVIDHLSVAFKALDDSVRHILFPTESGKFEKKIRILEPFDL